MLPHLFLSDILFFLARLKDNKDLSRFAFNDQALRNRNLWFFVIIDGVIVVVGHTTEDRQGILRSPRRCTRAFAAEPTDVYTRKREIAADPRFYRIQLYTVITLHTQLNTARLYMATTLQRTTQNVHNSIQHNSTRHNSTRTQLDTPQLYAATTRHATTLHRPHGRKVEATVANGMSKG